MSGAELSILRDVCDGAATVGDLVPDAVLASVAIENGCEIAALDRDFARFDGVRHLLIRT